MTDVNHKDLKMRLRVAYHTKQPLFIKGTMGIGKSAVVEELARELAEELGMEFVSNGWEEGKFGFIDTRLSQYEPTDLRGVPVPDLKEGTTNWLKPKTIPRGNSCGIWFFDELNLANHSVQAAAYQIIRDRKIDDMKIPDGWLVISAGNGSEDKANVFDMPAPLSNRFTHVELKKPSVDDWCEWATRVAIHRDVIAFLQFKPSYLHKFDTNIDEDAFATPRTWEMVSTHLKTPFKLSAKEERIVVASCVGDGVATEFMAFKKLANELDIDKIVNNPKDFKFPNKVDLKYALSSALAEKYSIEPKKLANIVKIWTKCDPEFTIISLKLAKGYRPKQFGTEMLKLKEWDILSKDFAKYVL